MNRIFIFSLTCAMMFVSLTGCDKVKDATSKDIEVNGVKFSFTAMTTEAGTEKTRGITSLTTFSVTREVSFAEIGSSELSDYLNSIKDVAVNSSLLRITTVPEDAITITNLKIEAAGVPGEILVPFYTVGNDFEAPANMLAYTLTFIQKLMENNPVSVTVSGETDAPEGVVINIIYENDLIFTVGLL